MRPLIILQDLVLPVFKDGILLLSNESLVMDFLIELHDALLADSLSSHELLHLSDNIIVQPLRRRVHIAIVWFWRSLDASVSIFLDGRSQVVIPCFILI